MSVSDDTRRLLARLASSERTRTSLFTAARPTHWAPYEVADPKTGVAFTSVGAWEFIVELLNGGIPIEIVVLDIPPGRTGYVLKIDGWSGCKIYIKLQLGSGIVFGRSFHISDR